MDRIPGHSARVVVPFAGNLRLEVVGALIATGRRWSTVDVSSSDHAYFDLLSELWSEWEDFVIVEHDVVVSEAALVSLEECPSDWCCCPYPYGRGTIVGLGCTKFTAALMEKIPDLLDLVGHLSDETHAPKHWCRLDVWIQRAIADLRAEDPEIPWRCIDHPEVGHLGRSRPSHGCRP